jgi:ribonucleotide reductase beta subunit family protein with ferritin-like domain
MLYNQLVHKLPKERIWEIFREAVDIETQFITESIPCKLVGMNHHEMIRYIKYVSNFWMHQMISSSGRKCPNYYTVKNPFSFMDRNGLENKTNFFEQRTTEYQRDIRSKVKNSGTFVNLDENF